MHDVNAGKKFRFRCAFGLKGRKGWVIETWEAAWPAGGLTEALENKARELGAEIYDSTQCAFGPAAEVESF